MCANGYFSRRAFNKYKALGNLIDKVGLVFNFYFVPAFYFVLLLLLCCYALWTLEFLKWVGWKEGHAATIVAITIEPRLF